MKKFIITENERKNILKMYGLLKEQVYMDKYPGTLLDFCGYRAIEKFEETMGKFDGTSMGDKYFEGKISSYETKITSNLTTHDLLESFNKFPNKLRRQIWSWMFNSTDASDGTIKYIAGLGQAINYSKYSGETEGQAYRIKVMKVGSPDYIKVINQIQNYNSNWNELYDNYVKVLDQQYKSTAENNNAQGSYDKSWKYRPTNLTKYYNECNPSETEDEKNDDKSSEENNTTSDVYVTVLKYGTLKELLNSINNDEMDILGKPMYDTNKKVLISLKDGNFSLSLPKGEETLNSLKLAFNIVSDHNSGVFPSKDSLQGKGYEVWDEGTFQLSGEGTRDWALMYN